MAENIILSKDQPELESMRFDFLREEGIKHIERLSGKLWTDFNLSDPGVTILEVLSYAITDLGYRTTYNVPDILAQNPNNPKKDLKNFYTAAEILPMSAVTYKDYRKLLIDIEINNPQDLVCPVAGVKNAWIQPSQTNEIPIYTDFSQDVLSYTPSTLNQAPLKLKPLYNVLLEFDSCDELGDLNANTIEGEIALYACADPGMADFDAALSGVVVNVSVEFPRWDDPQTDWASNVSIRSGATNLALNFENLPSDYRVDGYGLTPDKEIWLSITKANQPIGVNCILHQLEQLLFNPQNEDSFTSLYQRKIQKVFEIVKAVREKLMANRNLCEDFFQVNALKVEEILMCGDFVLSTDADIEEVEAQIYFAVRNFLSPTVYFYSLEEMYAKGYRTEEIFEGPLLNHGFIDDEELNNSGIRSSIHVSDIISIIMDIPGVEAVRNLQIANIPLNNIDGIPSQSVKWCLHLAFDKNYIPRLSVNKSNLTFLKEEIPYQSNRDEVDVLLEELIAAERPQKLYNTPLNIPVPEGNFRDLSDYQSIQEDFPLLYGIGTEGLPADVSEQRKAQIKQLKGFLLIFDQLFADYLAQLANIGSLFSMNGERGPDGEFIIDKSYFTQSLESIVPGIEDLLTDQVNYAEDLQDIAETENGFNERRNRFLNHLMARFGEQFTDYALLVYKLTGKKTPEELLVDKLNFLNQYPAISSGRFKAFNYESPCDIWSINNVSGLERRTSLLSGIDTAEGVTLSFSPDYNILEVSPSLFQFEISLPNYNVLSVESFTDQSLAMKQIEKLIVNGVNEENYTVEEDNGQYFIYITCASGSKIAKSGAFNTQPSQGQFNDFVGEAMEEFSSQYYNNPESNRNNLISPLANYFEVDTVLADMISDPPKYLMEYNLNYYPAGTDNNFELIEGPYIGYGKCKSSAGILAIDPVAYQVTVNGDLLEYLNAGDAVLIDDSQNNDGNYEVAAVVVDEPTPGEFRTIITFAGTPVLVDASPYGVLLYNKQTEQMLIDEGLSQIDQNLFDIASRGLLRSNYIFTEYDPLIPESYRFQITNACGEVIGTSEASNFNLELATAIGTPNGFTGAGIIQVINSTGNNGQYTVSSAVTQGALIRVTVEESIPSLIGNGQLVFEEKDFEVTEVNTFDHSMVVDGANLEMRLFIGDQFSVYNSTENDDVYTVRDILYNPVSDQTTVWVEEIIPDDNLDLGFIQYQKALEIIEAQTGSDAFIVKGGADEFAVQQLMTYFRKTFFSHEGMHLVEHILLRPKVREDLFLPFGDGVPPLDNNWSVFGMVTLGKQLEVTELNITENELVVAGDFTADFTPIQEIRITNSEDGLLDGTYHLISTYFDGTDTSIKVYEPLPDVSLTDYGNLQYLSTVPITDIPASELVIADVEASFVNPQVPIIISGSENGVNDGEYAVSNVQAAGTEAMMTVYARKMMVEDELLSVNLGDDCDACIIDDPYSFVLTAIMPAWQGRFSNQDFRAFFNRQFRLECPAHIVPNICWISNEQMGEFEKAWKRWLLENQRKNKDKVELSRALSEIIKVMKSLRSVYPQGTLHDCETSDTLDSNTIILNRTSLGTN